MKKSKVMILAVMTIAFLSVLPGCDNKPDELVMVMRDGVKIILQEEYYDSYYAALLYMVNDVYSLGRLKIYRKVQDTLFENPAKFDKKACIASWTYYMYGYDSSLMLAIAELNDAKIIYPPKDPK